MLQRLGGRGGDRQRGLFAALRRRRAQPSPRTVTPEPAVVTPEPEVVTPEPEVVTPEPEVVAPEPAVVTPEPAVVSPEPAAVTAEPLPTWAQETPSSLPTGKEIIEGWEQTSKGNCVTVAAIKAAQKTFGTELCNEEDPTRGVFSSANQLEDGGLDIVMRDGFELSLTAEELAAATSSSRFKTDVGREDLLSNANSLYAAAAKRAQMEGNDGYAPNTMSFAKSLQTLENGENTADIMEQVGRLGLKDYAKKVPRSELEDYDSTLSSGAGHAYFVSEGQRDYYGKVGPLGGGSYTTRGLFGRTIRHAGHSSKGTILQNEKITP